MGISSIGVNILVLYCPYLPYVGEYDGFANDAQFEFYYQILIK